MNLQLIRNSRLMFQPNSFFALLMKSNPNSLLLGLSIVGVASLGMTGMAGKAVAADATLSTPSLPEQPAKDTLRICFFTDSHLPGPRTHEHNHRLLAASPPGNMTSICVGRGSRAYFLRSTSTVSDRSLVNFKGASNSYQ